MVLTEGSVELHAEKSHDILILHVKGRLDALSSPKAEKIVFDWINEGNLKLLLNFSQVEYLSSAGMRMLLSTSKKLKASKGKLVLCAVTSNVMDVLKMSGFDRVLDIAKSQEEGVFHF
ncbi:MAG: anti-anti-sigma factor [Parachlamydia sp.]|nr:MAG: anti-anti-sigma factor [Parachlamydia sp.]